MHTAWTAYESFTGTSAGVNEFNKKKLHSEISECSYLLTADYHRANPQLLLLRRLL